MIPSIKAMLKMLVIIMLLIFSTSIVAAQNNPGHDTLYVEETGDSTITGTLGIRDSGAAASNATLYLGRYSGSAETIEFDTSEGTNGTFVFSKPILVPGASPAITFYDLNDPTDTAKYKSIVYNADSSTLQTGDAIITNFGAGAGAPPTGKTLVQFGIRNLSGQDSVGTYLGVNTPPGFNGHLLRIQKGDADKVKITNHGDLVLTSDTMTTNGPVLNTYQGWNSGGTTFTNWVSNVVDTASAADSKLLDLQVGGDSKLIVVKDGNVTAETDFCLESGACLSTAGAGTVTSVGATSPLSSTGGTTPVISINADGIDGAQLADTLALDANLAVTQGSYDVNFDSNTLFVDGSANRVGIGTASPGNNLEVAGNVSFASDTLTVSSSGVTRWGGGTSKHGVLTWSGGYASIYATSGNVLKLGANGGQGYVTINGSSVGIGTASPKQRVDISSIDASPSLGGASVTDAALMIGNSDPQYGTFFAVGGDGTGYIQQRRQSSAVYYNLSLQPYGGYVGIGTTAPSAALHVNTGSTMGWSDLSKSQLLVGTTTSGIGIDSNEIAIKGDNLYVGTIDSNYDIIFRAGGSTQRMIVEGGTGNIGIGTGTAPGEALDVTGNINASGEICDGAGNCVSDIASGSDDQTLTEVLASGNSAGTYDINMNNNAITNIDWSTSDDGASSGLDADLLDGISSSGFLQTAYLNGRSSADANTADDTGVTTYYLSSGAANKPTGTDHSLLTLSYSNLWSTQMAGDWRTNNFYVRNQSNGAWGTWSKLWHEGNDGPSSGLNADLLDGVQLAALQEDIAGTSCTYGIESIDDAGTITCSTEGIGIGNVTGPESSTDNAIARYNGTTGILIKNSGVTIDDSNDITVTGGRITGSNSEYISIGETDDIIEFQGESGTDNTDIAFDLDDTYPKIYSPTDSVITFSDNILLPHTYLSFYSSPNEHHSIIAKDSAGTNADDLRINTYGALYVNLDSNNNNVGAADFRIGRHGTTAAISDWFFTVDGETGNVSGATDFCVEGGACLSTSGVGSMSSFTLTGDSGTPETIVQGNQIDITGGTGISTAVSATDTVTVNLANTAVSPASYGSASQVGTFTVDAQGRLTTAASTSIAIAASQVTSGEFSEARVRKVESKDTRAINYNASQYTSSLQTDFKQNSADGLSDGGTYHGVISYRPYGSGTDWSGGPMHQLGFTTNENLFMRSSTGDTTWSAWKEIWSDANDGTGSGLDADLWDGNQFASYLDQAVLTTSAPTFATINTGSGAMELGDAAVANGDTNSIPTGDQVYDFVIGLGYGSGDGTVTSVTAGDGMTQTGTATINPTLNVVSHAGSAGSIGTINIGADAIGVNLGTTSTTAYRGDYGNTAYSERRQWDGGSTNLVASTGRTSLGLVAGGTGDIWVEKAGDAMTGDLSITQATSPKLTITATNTGADPAATATMEFVGYEGRGKGIFFTDADTSNEWFVGEMYSGTGLSLGYDTTGGGLSEYPGSSALSIDTSRRVGIGTTSPAQKLTVGNETSHYVQSYGGFIGHPTANIGGTGDAAYFPEGIYSAKHNWLYGGITMGGGAITGASTIDTGQGANELYDMDQNVLTTSAPTFATINTGSGAMELGDAAVANGDTNSIPTGDQVYDFVIGLGYGSGDGTVTGTGTDNYIPRWDAAGTGIENSIITDDSSTVTIAGDLAVAGGGLNLDDTANSQNSRIDWYATDGDTGYAHYTTSDRWEWTGGSFYITTGVPTTWIYSPTVYLGQATGSTVHARGTVWNFGDATYNTTMDFRLNGATNDLDFFYGGTQVGQISATDTTWFRINQDVAKNIYTPRYIRADSGLYVGGTTYGIASGGAITGATINTGSGAMELGDAAVANGDTDSIPTGDQVYDFVIAQSYITDDTSVPKNHLANSGTLSFDWADSEVADDITAGNVDGIDSTQFLRSDATDTMDAGTSTTLNILSDDAGSSTINVYGPNQGTGTVYVGQSATHGGGITYDGDGTPASVGATDHISIFRRTASADTAVLEWVHNSDQAEFRGNIDLNSNNLVGGGTGTFTGAVTVGTINTGSGAMELGDAAVANGDTNSIPTGDQVYDFVIGLGYGSGDGDVTGPASSTDNAIARFDSTTGKIIQNSGITIDDSNNIVTTGYLSGGSARVTNIVTNKIVKFDGTDLDDSIMTDDGSIVSIAGDLDVVGGDIYSFNNVRSDTDATLPRLVLDSTGAGDNWAAQGAYISLGESGDLGSAALHMTYVGNGLSYIGSGAPASGIPGASYIRFSYNSDEVYTPDNFYAGTLDTGSGDKELGDAAITNGDTNSIPTNDQVYDFVIGLGYGTGDITAVTAGTGIAGGATSGSAGIGIDTETFDDLSNRAPYVTGYGSGFYQTSTATTAENWPEDATWFHLINSQHTNTANNYAMQLAADFYQQDFYYRSTNAAGSTAWNEVWHEGSDGSGSGLDADLWDGNQFASYLDQAVLTTSAPTFATINTGSGAKELGDAAVANGDTNSIPTSDQVYDFVIGLGYGSGDGTVTSVAAGNGMDFTTITGTGSVTMGTPGTLSSSTTNAVTATSHTHDISDVYLLNSGDTGSGNLQLYSTDTAGAYNNAAVEIREVNQVTTGQSSWAYAPGLAFHWGGRTQTQLKLLSDGDLALGATDGGYSDFRAAQGIFSSAVSGTTFDSGSGAKDLGDAAVANGDTNSIPTGDQVYDFVIGLGYISDDTSVPKNHLANSGTLGFDWADSEIADDIRAGNLDGVDSSQFLRSDTADTLTSTMKITGAVIHEDTTSIGYIAHPKGAYFQTTSSSHTGGIKVCLPVVNTSDMMSFMVDVFDYSTGESITAKISGYNYGGGTAYWVNPSASIISDENRDYAVRYGESGGKDCVWIGETSSSWNYPQIIVRDFYGGYTTDIDQYDDGWTISIDSDYSDDQIETTLSNNLAYSDWNKMKNIPAGFADGTDADSGGDITDVVAGTDIDVSNSAGPNPTVTLETTLDSVDVINDLQFLDFAAGNDYEIRWWGGSDSYTISMGNDQNNDGTVTDYSMHFNMGSTANRGFTFGSSNTAVSASINALTGDIHSDGLITGDSGLKIATTTGKGTCDASSRGTFWIDQDSDGSGADADTLYICMKDATAATYTWVQVAISE